MHAFRAEITQTTREWVDHWRREGVYRDDVDADLASTLIGGAYTELSTRMIGEEKRPPLEAWLRFATETFFRAFGAPEMVTAIEQRNRRVNLDKDDKDEELRTRGAPRARRGRPLERGRVT